MSSSVNIGRRSVLWSPRLVSALILVLIAGCGGGGGGGAIPVPTPYPVSVSSPVDSSTSNVATYQTDGRVQVLSGSAFVPEGSLCQCVGLACFFGRGTVAPGYQVTWTNVGTGDSGSASFYLNCLLQVKVIWTADVPLAPGANLLRIDARDSSGHVGSATLEVTRLPDATPPQVASISPIDGAANIGVNVSIGIRFNEPMDAVSIDTGTLQLSDAGGNPIASSVVAGAAADTWQLTPLQALDYATEYRVSIGTGVRDLTGNALALPVTSRFTTTSAPDVLPPVLTAANPPDGSACAGATTPVVVTFNEDVKDITLRIGLTGPNGLPVSGSVSHQEGTLFWSFHAFDGLAPDIVYAVSVAAGLTDYSNNATTSPFTWTFRTSADGVDHCN